MIKIWVVFGLITAGGQVQPGIATFPTELECNNAREQMRFVLAQEEALDGYLISNCFEAEIPLKNPTEMGGECEDCHEESE